MTKGGSMKGITKFEMIDYDPTREDALFVFYNEAGRRQEMWQKRHTFLGLFLSSREWFKLYPGQQKTNNQVDLYKIAKTMIDGKPEDWFEKESNKILKAKANG